MLTITAGQTYTQTGSDLLTPQGDMNIAAKRIDIDAAIDATQDTRFRQSGLTLQVTSPVLSAIQTVQQMQQAASKTKDGRMQVLAAATAVSSSAMPEIAKAIDGMGLPEVVQKGLEQVVATALGAAVGGAAGAVSGVNVEANNRQLHQSEKELIAKKANGNKDTEERLTKAACYAVQCWAEYPEDSKEHSEKYVSVMDIYDLKNEMAWIKEQQEKGTFVYTPTQETVDYIKNDLKTNVLPVASNSLKMVTGGLSAATGTTLCSTTGVGCAPGSLLITFGVSNLTEGLSGLYRQYQGIDTVGYNPLKYWFNQADPVWGNTMYYSLDFAVAIMAMRAQVPLNLGVADGLGRPTSMFGVTVSNFSNIKLNPFTKMPLPYGVNQGSLAIGAGAKGVEIINSISIAEDKK